MQTYLFEFKTDKTDNLLISSCVKSSILFRISTMVRKICYFEVRINLMTYHVIKFVSIGIIKVKYKVM